MRLATSLGTKEDLDDLFGRVFGPELVRPLWRAGSGEVPTDVFRTDEELVVRMDLPEVDPDSVDVTVQDNVLLINGTRRFPYDTEKVQFLRRGTFYGDFTQKVSLGKGLDVSKINANYSDGVLELKIPFAEEIQPRKISVDFGSRKALK
jgi:HSP20 family protein